MSGHSKWSTIKRKKGALDAKRGKIFTKIIRELTVAAKTGGGDPNDNPRLRLAVDKAKAVNMPADNIQRAIKKGSGGADDGVTYSEYFLEGYGPEGVAVMVEVMTDNKNRTTPEVRRLFESGGGSMGAAGCVAWQFQKKGVILIDRQKSSEEQLMEIVLDAGADDIRENNEGFEIVTSPENFMAVKQKLEAAQIPLQHGEVSLVPQNHVTLSGKSGETMLKLMESLEDHDDVQNVYANFDLSDG